MKTKRLLPSKASLIEERNRLAWANNVLSKQTAPWLAIPGLIIFLDTENKVDMDLRFEILDLAKATLFKNIKQ